MVEKMVVREKKKNSVFFTRFNGSQERVSKVESRK